MSDFHATFWVVMMLFLVGLMGMMTRPHFMKKLMAMNILQVSIILFFVSLAVKEDGASPVLPKVVPQIIDANSYMNPLPHALMLTAIVVSVATTALGLSILYRIHKRYRTLDENKLLKELQK